MDGLEPDDLEPNAMSKYNGQDVFSPEPNS